MGEYVTTGRRPAELVPFRALTGFACFGHTADNL